MTENTITTMQEEMRERIRAALAGESDEARRMAIAAVEAQRWFRSAINTPSTPGTLRIPSIPGTRTGWRTP